MQLNFFVWEDFEITLLNVYTEHEKSQERFTPKYFDIWGSYFDILSISVSFLFLIISVQIMKMEGNISLLS
jgi:hypothetical protein